MEELFNFIKKFGFRRCDYCGKIIWKYNRRFEKYCSAKCLFQDYYKEKIKKSEKLYLNVSSVLDRMNILCKELNDIMRKYTDEGR